jgi:hypothetical protein
MPTFLWILIVIVVVVLATRRSSKTPAEPTVSQRFAEVGALEPKLAAEGARMAEALPIVDKATSWLLHEPVLDARHGFDPPCVASDFESSDGKCWQSRDALPEVFQQWAHDEAMIRLEMTGHRTSVLVPAAEHIDIIRCHYSVNEPGLGVVRICRVAEDKWHTIYFSCGMAPGANAMALQAGNMRIEVADDSAGIDPPLLATAVAENPSLWTERNDEVRRRWRLDGDWRDAVAMCKHRPER